MSREQPRRSEEETINASGELASGREEEDAVMYVDVSNASGREDDAINHGDVFSASGEVGSGREEGIRYGDVFNVSGKLALQPIAPQDAAAMEAAENAVLGQICKGGPAAIMQLAAQVNQRSGVVRHDEMTDAVEAHGATVAEAEVGGYHILTEAIGGEVLGQYSMEEEVQAAHPSSMMDSDLVTIGEALEASALSGGDKPVDNSDVAAIQAAEVCATGLGHVVPWGITAEAKSAAKHNLQTDKDEDKIKLGDILIDATAKLPDDKAVTMEVAQGVVSAEMRNTPAGMATNPDGVAASVTAAARLNQEM